MKQPKLNDTTRLNESSIDLHRMLVLTVIITSVKYRIIFTSSSASQMLLCCSDRKYLRYSK
ncbi:hypothetical protein ACF0H5_015334 [Mactra antiquata]